MKNWRFGYNKQIVKLARIGCESPKAALGSAVGGLKHMYETFVFHSADQKLTGPFGATVDKVKDSFHTGIVKGKKSAKGPIAYKVPYDGGWHPTKPKPRRRTRYSRVMRSRHRRPSGPRAASSSPTRRRLSAGRRTTLPLARRSRTSTSS